MAQLIRRSPKKLKRRETNEAVSQVVETSKKQIEKAEVSSVDPDWLIPTGSTLLNCACSDYSHGGYGIGKLVNLIGDSSSGKSLLALTCFAEMYMFNKWNNYRLIYDDVEAALEFNVNYLFGVDIGQRIETDIVSSTVQDFYANILKAIHQDTPFVYIIDSLDALTSEEEQDRGQKMAGLKKQSPREKQTGSYKTEKAKLLSEILRVTAREIKLKEALIVIISQTRDSLGFGFTSKVRSGGRALKFYSAHEMWLSIKEPIRKGKKEVGIHSNIKVSKNKLTGKKRNVDAWIYDEIGVDDISANINFLVDEGYWKKDKNTILATDLNLKGEKATIIKGIEDRMLEQEVQKIVGAHWKTIEEDLKLGRKRRYK